MDDFTRVRIDSLLPNEPLIMLAARFHGGNVMWWEWVELKVAMKRISFTKRGNIKVEDPYSYSPIVFDLEGKCLNYPTATRKFCSANPPYSRGYLLHGENLKRAYAAAWYKRREKLDPHMYALGTAWKRHDELYRIHDWSKCEVENCDICKELKRTGLLKVCGGCGHIDFPETCSFTQFDDGRLLCHPCTEAEAHVIKGD